MRCKVVRSMEQQSEKINSRKYKERGIIVHEHFVVRFELSFEFLALKEETLL